MNNNDDRLLFAVAGAGLIAGGHKGPGDADFVSVGALGAHRLKSVRDAAVARRLKSFRYELAALRYLPNVLRGAVATLARPCLAGSRS